MLKEVMYLFKESKFLFIVNVDSLGIGMVRGFDLYNVSFVCILL